MEISNQISVLLQLRSYAEQAEQDGWYYGRRDKFKQRHEKIIAWLDAKIEEAETKKRK